MTSTMLKAPGANDSRRPPRSVSTPYGTARPYPTPITSGLAVSSRASNVKSLNVVVVFMVNRLTGGVKWA